MEEDDHAEKGPKDWNFHLSMIQDHIHQLESNQSAETDARKTLDAENRDLRRQVLRLETDRLDLCAQIQHQSRHISALKAGLGITQRCGTYMSARLQDATSNPAGEQKVEGPMEKIHHIAWSFSTGLLQQYVELSANPPADIRKCEDEHRKLSEMIMQHVLLKLDEVDTYGNAEIRAKRKELIDQVQEVLKSIDAHLPNTKDSY